MILNIPTQVNLELLTMFKLLRHRIAPVLSIQTCAYNATSGPHKPAMPTNLTKDTDVTTREKLEEIMRKDDTKWRTPWHQKEGQYYSVLRTFYSEHNNRSVIKFLQTPINLSPSVIKKWWAKKERYKSIVMQQYLPQRNQVLGNELAAAHFVVHRGGAVKFFGQDCWIKANQFNEYELPDRFNKDWILQAIDCTDMELHYEGLVNMRDLKQVEWFSVNGCENIDDWCMDRIANIFGRTLLYLDIRDCRNITHRGIGALARMEKLKILYVDNILYSKEFEMTCLMLQQLAPHLDIRTE